MKKITRLRDLKLKELRFKRKQYRVGLIALGIVATIILAFNFWFIDHAESAIEQIVERQSKGKLKLKVEKFKFNWIKNKIEFQNALFYSTDSSATSLYRVNVKKITVKAKGFLPLLFNKQILIDSIHLYSPNVTLTRVNKRIKKASKNKDATDVSTDDKFSVAKEMGRISNSISNAISELKINRFILDDGSLSLIDKTRPEETPFVVNKIHIRLDGLQVDSTTTRKNRNTDEKIPFTDDIAIQTHDQNIIFPGNRHMLSFKNFKFTLQDKRVEFDSCTIRGTKGDSSKSAFKIFFNKLRLTNIDFDTLYHAEVVKADSVYCTNPGIFLDIDSDQKTGKKNKKIQRIDELIQQLLGDIMLNYVVVENADININTIKKGKANSFVSKNNNFELQGLVVRQNYERPVKVDKFLMTLHNYETQLQDGRYSIAFDSVQFLDDAINLTKFSFKEFNRGKIISDVKMPRFELRGLSWESLLYDNVFNANSAMFFNPDIEYTVRPKKPKRAKSIFETLSDVGDIMNLSALGIQEGTINLNLGKGATLKLNKANLSVMPDELTASKKVKNIQHSIKELNFSAAIFKKGTTTATLNKVKLDGRDGIKANNVTVNGKGVNAKANTVSIKDMILDSTNQNLLLSGVRWGSAAVVMNKKTKGSGKKKMSLTGLLLQNLLGHNTSLKISQDDKNISAYFKTLAVKEVYKKANADIVVEGLSIAGSDFLMTAPGQKISVDQMLINDKANSIFKNFRFEQLKDIDSIYIDIPQIAIIPNISRIINGNLQLNKIILSDPNIVGHFGKKDSVEKKEAKKKPEIILGEALLERPKVELSFINKKNEKSTLKWNGEVENSYLRIRDLKSTDKKLLEAKEVKIYLTNFEFLNNANGNRFATNYNKLNILLHNLEAEKNSDQKVDWRTLLSVVSMDKLVFDSLGKKNAVLKLDKGEIKNINLNSKDLKNVGELIKNSTALDINHATGSYTTGKNNLQWYNFNFKGGYFKVDSFHLAPNQSIEDYKKAKAFNEDYLKLQTGTITGGPFDTERYGTDSLLKIGGLQIKDARLLSFKDKTQPDTAKKYKLLPSDQILKIPIKILIDSVGLSNMYVEYWEINPKTKTLGIIPVNDLNVNMYHIKNFDIQPNDSLFIYARANVLDALDTRLEVRESYSDSLGRFLMKLRTGPLELKKWNEVLIPLVGAEVVSGDLDSLNMAAIGNNNYSKGSMQMYYQGLRLRLLNKKDPTKQSLGNKIINWAANTFIVRKNNKGKDSPVFFERLTDKSPINFLIKSILTGIKSSIGLPGLKGKERRYMKKVNKSKVPVPPPPIARQ